MAAVLRLPLTAVVLATLLTANSGPGVGPLAIIGSAVAYLTAIALDQIAEKKAEDAAQPVEAGADAQPAGA
jgi:hypothetical protein